MPNSAYIFAAGPLTVCPPIMGETARTVFAARAGRRPASARIGSILTQGLDGHTTIASAFSIASKTPGAGCASSIPANRKPLTFGSQFRWTKYSWKGQLPILQGIHHSANRLVAHRQDQLTHAPGLAELLRDLAEHLPFPQTAGPLEMRGQSLSPMWNQSGPPSFWIFSSAWKVSACRPQPVLGFANPASV